MMPAFSFLAFLSASFDWAGNHYLIAALVVASVLAVAVVSFILWVLRVAFAGMPENPSEAVEYPTDPRAW